MKPYFVRGALVRFDEAKLCPFCGLARSLFVSVCFCGAVSSWRSVGPAGLGVRRRLHVAALPFFPWVVGGRLFRVWEPLEGEVCVDPRSARRRGSPEALRLLHLMLPGLEFDVDLYKDTLRAVAGAYLHRSSRLTFDTRYLALARGLLLRRGAVRWVGATSTSWLVAADEARLEKFARG